MTNYTLDTLPPQSVIDQIQYIVGTIDAFGDVEFELRCTTESHWFRYARLQILYDLERRDWYSEQLQWLKDLIEINNGYERDFCGSRNVLGLPPRGIIAAAIMTRQLTATPEDSTA